SEHADILRTLAQESPRIAILGPGGIGKTTLAKAVLHHPKVEQKYGQNRIFMACDTTGSASTLAALIGSHLGLKPNRKITHLVVDHLSSIPSCLLISDNLETAWEPSESRREVEEFLSLLTDVRHLALIIDMRGAERPGKVQWSRPFFRPLAPLTQTAAHQVFIDIADNTAKIEDIEKVLSLTDNVPLAITLLAHLCDRKKKKTSTVSEGYNKRSKLNLFIQLSLSSPRISALPQSKQLLSLLELFPDGISDQELKLMNLT
ncbi:hypothetical protein DFH09DRAFT_850493, partial [Mycena vulgaris]